jgi:hypothetical protein
MRKQGKMLSHLKITQKKDQGISLGRIQNSILKKEYLTEKELNHHVHVVGASGFGKTVFLSHIIRDRISKGKGVLFIDLKNDSETLNRFTKFVKDCGREKDLQVFSISDTKTSTSYNLISEGTATQLRDKIMLSLNWSEEYYKNQSGSFLLKLLIGLVWLRDNKNIEFNLGTVLDASKSQEKILELTQKVPNTEVKIKLSFEDCYNFLSSNDNFKSLQGLRSQLESLVLSDFGDLLTSNEKGINLFDSVQNQKITFVILDSRRYGETAKTLGKFILQDLKMTSAKIDDEVPGLERKPFVCVIDEFADLASEDFIGFLDRARSSKMSIVVAHQEICDLNRISPEFAGRLMGNTSTLYAFLQKRPESAEIISGIAGTRTVWKTTRQTERFWLFNVDTGRGSQREAEEFIVHPNRVKGLGVGECVCIKKYPTARAHVVTVDEK